MAKKTVESKKKTAAPKVRVKSNREVFAGVQRVFEHTIHDRYGVHLSKNLQKKLVAYGPWLAGLTTLVITPQLLVLAKDGNLMSLSGFFEKILFNQAAWVILIIMFVNVLLFVDGLNAIFEKQRKGWDRIYLSVILSTLYIFWQFASNLNQPAAPLLALIASCGLLFILLDIRSYYQ